MHAATFLMNNLFGVLGVPFNFGTVSQGLFKVLEGTRRLNLCGSACYIFLGAYGLFFLGKILRVERYKMKRIRHPSKKTKLHIKKGKKEKEKEKKVKH